MHRKSISGSVSVLYNSGEHDRRRTTAPGRSGIRGPHRPVRGCLQVTAGTDAESSCAEGSDQGRAGDLSSQARASGVILLIDLGEVVDRLQRPRSVVACERLPYLHAHRLQGRHERRQRAPRAAARRSRMGSPDTGSSCLRSCSCTCLSRPPPVRAEDNLGRLFLECFPGNAHRTGPSAAPPSTPPATKQAATAPTTGAVSRVA